MELYTDLVNEEKANGFPVSPLKAQKAWVILISLAMNNQTTLYETMAKRLGVDKRGVGNILLYIQCYCDFFEIPMLNCLVIKTVEGIPGEGIKEMNWCREVRKVHTYDWFNVIVPSTMELEKIKSTY